MFLSRFRGVFRACISLSVNDFTGTFGYTLVFVHCNILDSAPIVEHFQPQMEMALWDPTRVLSHDAVNAASPALARAA